MSSPIKFVAKRINKLQERKRLPDFEAMLTIEGKDYSLVGWQDVLSSDISFILDEITYQRLAENKFLRERYDKFKEGKRGG